MELKLLMWKYTLPKNKNKNPQQTKTNKNQPTNQRSGFLNLMAMNLNFFLDYNMGSCVEKSKVGSSWKCRVPCVASPWACYLSWALLQEPVWEMILKTLLGKKRGKTMPVELHRGPAQEMLLWLTVCCSEHEFQKRMLQPRTGPSARTEAQLPRLANNLSPLFLFPQSWSPKGWAPLLGLSH